MEDNVSLFVKYISLDIFRAGSFIAVDGRTRPVDRVLDSNKSDSESAAFLFSIHWHFRASLIKLLEKCKTKSILLITLLYQRNKCEEC